MTSPALKPPPQGAVNSLAPQPVDSSRGAPILSPRTLKNIRPSSYIYKVYTGEPNKSLTTHPHHSQPPTPASTPRPLDLMGASHPKGTPHNRPYPKPTPAPATSYPAPLNTAASSPAPPPSVALVCPAALTRHLHAPPPSAPPRTPCPRSLAPATGSL